MENVEVLLLAALLTTSDQLSKLIFLRHFHSRKIDVAPQLRFRLVTNNIGGPTFTRALIILWILAVFSVSVITWQQIFFESWLAYLGLALSLGGATSNLIDRVWRRQVIDFIELGFWPVFNLADVAIVSGLVLAFGFR